MADPFDASDFVPDTQPSATSASAFSAHDFVPDPPPPEPDHSFSGDVESDLTKRAADYFKSGDTSMLHAMGTGFGAVNDVAGEAIKRAPGYDAITGAAKSLSKSAADALDETDIGKWAGDKMLKASDKLSQFAQDHPDITRHAGDVANIAGGSALTDGVVNTARGVGNLAQDAYDARLASTGATLPKGIPIDVADARGRNYQYINGINQNMDAMKGIQDEATGQVKGGYGEIYAKAGDVSRGVTVNAPKAKSNVGALLEDMEDDMAHKTEQGSSQAYRDLKAVHDSFDESGEIPLDKVTLLKRRLNDLYDPNMGQTRGEIYARLNQQVNNITKQARVENPEWAKLMDSGNNLFLNDKMTRDSLSKAWSATDRKEYTDALAARGKDPYSAPPSAEVRQKIQDISTPKNTEQYEDTLRVLPKELHDQYTKDVIANTEVKNPKLAAFLRGVYKATVGNKFGASNDFYRAITAESERPIDPALANSFPHYEDAMKYHGENADAVYQTHLDNLYNSQNPPAPLALPAPATRLPAEQSGLYPRLPAPDPTDPRFPMVNDRSGNFGDPARGKLRHMTPDELEDYIAKQQKMGGPDIITPAERAAQQDRNAGAVADSLRKAGETYAKDPLAQSHGAKYAVDALQANKADMDAAWDRLSTADQAKKIGDIESAWKGHEGDLRQHILESRARAQQLAAAKGEQYTDTAMSDALLRALGERNRGGAAFARGGAVNKQPTEAQKAVGNYKKGHVKLHGLNITIENPKGSKRSGVSAGGVKWESSLAADYGYIRNTIGNDGDHIDCFIGPNQHSKRIYVIDQKNDDGKFDEHKCMLNFTDRASAEKAYKDSFSDKKNRIMKITRLNIPEFKTWLKEGNTKRPVRKAA